MRTEHSLENAVQPWNRYSVSNLDNKSGIDDKTTPENSEGHENDLIRHEEENPAVKLDLRTLQDMPDEQKTPYEKNEQKRLEKLSLTGRSRLDPDQRAMIKELESIEKEVIRHERAHQATGGNAVGPASYQYTMGPDNRYYITGGQVSFDLPVTATPESMLKAFERLRASSGTASSVSGQDSKMALLAEAKIREIKTSLRVARGKRAYYQQMIRNRELKKNKTDVS